MDLKRCYDRKSRKWVVELNDFNKYIAERSVHSTKEEAENQESKISEKYGISWFYTWTMDKIINDILKEIGVSCSASRKSSPSMLHYSLSDNEIRYNLDYLLAYFKNNLIPAIPGAKAAVYHEVGHHFDRDKLLKIRPKADSTNEEWYKYRIEAEYRAWQLGRYFVPDNLLLLYDDINHSNIRAVEKKYGKRKG
jgi:hypothetical protein